MSIFSVKGGTRLKGVYRVSGAKNAAPKLLLASLLTKERCVFENIPNFSDTQQMVTALQRVGVRMRSLTPHTIEAQGETIVRTRGNQCSSSGRCSREQAASRSLFPGETPSAADRSIVISRESRR